MKMSSVPVDRKSGFKRFYFSWNSRDYNACSKQFGKLAFFPSFKFDSITIGPGSLGKEQYLLDEVTVWDEWTPPSVNINQFMNCTGWLTEPAADHVFRALEWNVRRMRRQGYSIPYANIPLAVGGVVGIRIRHKLQPAESLKTYQGFVEYSCNEELARLAQIEAGVLKEKRLPEIDYSSYSLQKKAYVDANKNPLLMFRLMYNPDVWFLSPFSDEYILYTGRSAERVNKKIKFLLENESFGVYASPADLVRKVPRDALGYALSSKKGMDYVNNIISKLKRYHPFRTPNIFLFNFLNFESGGGLCYASENIHDFQKWLKIKYGTIKTLNFNWNSDHQSFNTCQPPRWRRGQYKITPDNRAAWGDWLAYMTERNTTDYRTVKRHFDNVFKPHVPMNYIDASVDSFPNHAGVTCLDWEALADINDVMVAENSMKSLPAPYCIEPFGSLQADFRTSLITANKAVVNMEMHCGTFGGGPFVDNYYSCSIMRDYLHGKSVIHLWQAMRPWGKSLFRGKGYSLTPKYRLAE
jgi:hypothetical protein